MSLVDSGVAIRIAGILDSGGFFRQADEITYLLKQSGQSDFWDGWGYRKEPIEPHHPTTQKFNEMQPEIMQQEQKLMENTPEYNNFYSDSDNKDKYSKFRDAQLQKMVEWLQQSHPEIIDQYKAMHGMYTEIGKKQQRIDRPHTNREHAPLNIYN